MCKKMVCVIICHFVLCIYAASANTIAGPECIYEQGSIVTVFPISSKIAFFAYTDGRVVEHSMVTGVETLLFMLEDNFYKNKQLFVTNQGDKFAVHDKISNELIVFSRANVNKKIKLMLKDYNPYIAIGFNDSGNIFYLYSLFNKKLTIIDCVNGEILSTIDFYARIFSITGDGRFYISYWEKTMKVYDSTSKLLWQRQFDKSIEIDSVSYITWADNIYTIVRYLDAVELMVFSPKKNKQPVKSIALTKSNESGITHISIAKDVALFSNNNIIQVYNINLEKLLINKKAQNGITPFVAFDGSAIYFIPTPEKMKINDRTYIQNKLKPDEITVEVIKGGEGE